jgi:nitrogen fixation protein FixH
MTMQQMSSSTRALTLWHLVRVLAAIAAVILAVGVLYAAFGPHLMGPTYQIVPDPAGPLPF